MVTGVEVEKDVEVDTIEDVRVVVSSVGKDSELETELDSESEEDDSESEELLLDSVGVDEDVSVSETGSVSSGETEVKVVDAALSVNSGEKDEVNSLLNTEVDSVKVDVDDSAV